ncbi:MAG: type II toxin-antitoxin system VapC family toxin [Verrucomicrobia bacterium]|nr:type II toxin-antitoxin system VapC family toxin [Verrucomicrobiota bacterium]
MNYLVDTNILTHPARRTPSPRVLEWLRANQTGLYTSVLVIGEIVYGIQKLPHNSQRRQALEVSLQQTRRVMEGRVLSLNSRVADEWGRLVCEMEVKGQLLPVVDSLLAATARRYQLTVATDNTSDFAHTGLHLVNPLKQADD